MELIQTLGPKIAGLNVLPGPLDLKVARVVVAERAVQGLHFLPPGRGPGRGQECPARRRESPGRGRPVKEFLRQHLL